MPTVVRSPLQPVTVGSGRQSQPLMVLMALVLAIITALNPVSAQVNNFCGTEETIEGIIGVAGGNELEVVLETLEPSEEDEETAAPRVFRLFINSLTQIRNESGATVALSALSVGTPVRVRFCTGNRIALRIDVRSETSNVCQGERDLEGTLQGTNSIGQLLINGLPYAIGQNSNFRDAENNPLPLSAFTVGDRVRVRFCAILGSPVPRVIVLTLLANNERAVSEGTITEVRNEPFAIVVEGRPWAILSTTAIRNDDGARVDPRALRVGVEVRVEGLNPAPGSDLYRAQAVEIRSDEDDHDTPILRVRGAITAINAEARSFTLRDFNVVTTENTEFELKGDNDESSDITFGDLAVGQVVIVEGMPMAQVAIFPPPPPAIEAVEVTVLEGVEPPPPPPATDFAIRGFLQRVTDGGALILLNGAVRTDEATVFTDAPTSSTITLADLVPGDFLHIEGVVGRESGRLARTVVRTNPVGRPFVFFGEVRAVGENRLRVNDRVFVLTDDTRVFGAENAELTIADLVVGQRVEVAGTELPGRPAVAERISIRQAPRPVCRPNVEFRGVITARNEGSIVVGERTVTFTNTTEVRDRNGRPMQPRLLVVGMAVKVAGVTGESSVAACEIRVLGEEPVDPNPITQIIGIATEVNPSTNSLVIRNTTILVTAETRIEARRDDDDTTLTLADVAVGDLLLVRGNLMADGTFRARLIVIQEERVPEPPVRIARVEGIVNGIDLPTSLTVGRTTVLIPTSGEFEIEGLDGEVSSLEDLSVGDLVVAKGVVSAERVIVAREIEVRAAILTSIDTAARRLTLNGLDVRTTTATLYLTRTTNPPSRITFGDLAIGDLLRVRCLRTNAAGDLVALQVTQLRTATFLQEPGDGFVPPIFGIEDGRPTLTTESNDDTFGFIGLPEEAFPIAENALYEVIARVRGSLPNRSDVPTVRLRQNNANFQKGQELVVESVGDANYVPTPAGREIRSYFVPSQPPANALQLLRSWFASIDVINFGRLNAAVARFRLDDLSVRAIPMERVQVAATLVDESFDNGAGTWEFRALGGRYTTPVSNSGVAGSLDLVPVEINSVGWWSGDAGVTIEGDTLYRGRFFVRSGATDSAKVPTFRVRMNLRSFQLAAVNVITSTGAGDESPTAEGRLYDVYLYVPGPVAANEGIIASIDIVHTEADDEFAPVSLDNFTLEKLTILPE